MRRIDHLRRVAGQKHAVGVKRRHDVIAAFGNQMGRVLQRRRSLDVAPDQRMALEVFQKIVGFDVGPLEIIQRAAQAQREGFFIGVHKSIAEHSFGDVPHHLGGRPLVSF